MTARPMLAPPTDSDAERRTRIRARLSQFGQGPAALFHDLCLLLDEDLGMATQSMMVSHLLRELESSVREVLLPRPVGTVDEDPEPASTEHPVLVALRLLGGEVLCAVGWKKTGPGETPEGEPERASAGSTHRREISEVLGALGIDPDGSVGTAWRKVAGDQHALAHRSNLAAPRQLEGRVSDHVERGMIFLDAVLDAFDARFLDLVDRLEKLAATPAPTKKDATRLLKEFPQDLVTAERFFDGLVNASWLGPLNSVKLFSDPPAPEVDRDAGRISFVRWPASAYLARVATDDPATALHIARAIPATDNPYVHLDLVAVASSVPAAKAVQLVPTLTRALEGPYLWLPDRYANLALHLAREQQTQAAVKLLAALLAAGFGPDAKLAEEDSAHLLHTFNDDFADHLGTAWLRLLADALATSLGPAEQAQQRRGLDQSAFWLPLLSATPDIIHATPLTRLAIALRDAAERLVTAAPATAEEILGLLDARPWAIFRRLRLHLITRHADALPGGAAAALADPAVREDIALEREWLALAAAFAGRLSQEQQEALLGAVEQGPDTARWSRDHEQRTGEPLAPERVRAVADLWQRDCYSALGAILRPAQRERLTALEMTYGRARPVDEPPFRVVPIITTPPEAEPGPLAELSVRELVERAKSWIPQPNDFGGTNQFALASRLGEAVAAQAARYSADAAAFAELDDLYLLQVLYGFQTAARREPIDWAGPLALAAEATRRSGSTHAHELHREAANMVAQAIAHPVNPAEPADADTLWSTLSAVLASPDTPPPAPDTGSFLNDARAQSLRAAVTWALWRRHSDADTSPLFRLLDRLLDDVPLPNSDGPQIQAAVLGGLVPQLAYLDPKWTANRALPLLSTGEHAVCAWHAYLDAPPYRPAAEQVLDLYRDHAAQTEAHGDNRSEGQRLALGRHILDLYLDGTFELDGNDSPVPIYYQRSSSATLKHLATSVGAGVNNLSDQALPRMQAWWAWRLNAATAAVEPAARTELTDTLPALAASGRLPDPWILQQFRDLLRASGELRPDSTTFTYLTRVTADHTDLVLLLLKDWIMTLGPYDPMPRFREADLRALLRTALADPQHTPLATDIINRAATRGHSQFRALLHAPAPETEATP
ncbi:hypothetical protein ACIQPR_10020 [Streptomyces sp. NPDC091280]|uniref:hypothetical protein n=1 Tax=Streptomyces sp. NPDC091280 TaxID=3365984 RepID=UPI00380E707D